MVEYRLTHAARADIESILARSHQQFGQQARRRYEALIVAAIRNATSHDKHPGFRPRPELGPDVFTWHLSHSRDRSAETKVSRPRHFLVCKRNADMLVIGRVLHDAMDLTQHADVGEDLSEL